MADTPEGPYNTISDAANAMLGVLSPETLTEDRNAPQTETPPAEPPAGNSAPATETAAPEQTEETLEVETDDAPKATESQPITIKVDGQELKVTLDELKNGYQRDADYRKKTADLAKQRQALAEEAAQIAQARNFHLSQLEAILPQIQQQMAGEFSDIRTQADLMKLAESDPQRYVRFQALRDQQAHLAQQRAQLAEQQRAEQQKQMMDFARQQNELLVQKLPIMGDPDKGPAERKSIADYLGQQGFSADEIAQAVDARMILVARKAMLYDRAVKARADAQAKVTTAPQVQKPGAKNTGKDDAERQAYAGAMDKLRKTGRIDAAADAFRRFI